MRKTLHTDMVVQIQAEQGSPWMAVILSRRDG